MKAALPCQRSCETLNLPASAPCLDLNIHMLQTLARIGLGFRASLGFMAWSLGFRVSPVEHTSRTRPQHMLACLDSGGRRTATELMLSWESGNESLK